MAKRKEQTGTAGNTELSNRLKEYSVTAGGSVAANKPARRVGNWSIYAAATGSAFAMATNASASIIYGTYSGSGPNGGAAVQTHSGVSSVKGLFFGLSHTTAHRTTHQFATVHGTVPDEINIAARNTNGSQLFVAGVAPYVRIFEATTNAQGARNFAAGARIGPSVTGGLGFGLKVAASIYSARDYGLFLAGQSGYAGFAVSVGGGKIDYGWLKLEFTDMANSPPILEALSAALETNPGQAILAGQTSDAASSPEPGTLCLGLLAAGAMGVMALRRRRNTAS